MRTLIDLDDAPVFAIPAADGSRMGVLVEGPQGWGEFSPPAGCDDAVATRWLTSAMEPSTVGWPDAVRGRVPVAGARVAIRAHQQSPGADVARLASVRDALDRGTPVRWAVEVGDVDHAVSVITQLARAAGGVEPVELVCRSVEDAAAVRRRVHVPIAVAATLLTEAGPDVGAADLAILQCGPLGGVRRAMRRAETVGLPCLVNLTGQTSIGQAGDVALAAVLPDLPWACGPAAGSLADGDVVAPARSLIPVDGYLPAAPMPAAPDTARLAQFTVTDPVTIRQWRNLLRRAATVR